MNNVTFTTGERAAHLTLLGKLHKAEAERDAAISDLWILYREHLKSERESAEENTCIKHPMTILFYGCYACHLESKADNARLRATADTLRGALRNAAESLHDAEMFRAAEDARAALKEEGK